MSNKTSFIRAPRLGIYFLTVLTLSSLAFPLAAVAGPGRSGGGKGVVCRNTDGSIKSVELLDLWEARTIYGRQVVESSDPVIKQIHRALEPLAHSTRLSLDQSTNPPDTYSRSVEEFKYMLRYSGRWYLDPKSTGVTTRYLSGVHLELTPDSQEVARPNQPGCEIEQIIVYQYTPKFNEVLINKDIFDRMSPTQQAALLVHEFLYTALKKYYAKEEANSLRVRRSVGLAFSDGKFVNIQEHKVQKYVVCERKNPRTEYSVELFDVTDGPLVKDKTLTPHSVLMRVNKADSRILFNAYTSFRLNSVEEKEQLLLKLVSRTKMPGNKYGKVQAPLMWDSGEIAPIVEKEMIPYLWIRPYGTADIEMSIKMVSTEDDNGYDGMRLDCRNGDVSSLYK